MIFIYKKLGQRKVSLKRITAPTLCVYSLSIFFVCFLSFKGPALPAKLESKTSKDQEITPKATPKKWIQLKKSLKKRKNTLFSPILQRRLERLHRILKKDKTKALKLIENLERIAQKRPSELAKIHLLKAQIFLSLEKPKKALLYYQKAKKSQKLSLREHLSLLHDMIYLHLSQKELNKANETSHLLFFLSESPYPPDLHILKAYILIEQNQKKSALNSVNKALKSSQDPKEHWLALGAGLNFHLQHYIPATKLLLKLVALRPKKKQYWKQLSSAYLNIDKNHKALATLDLANKQSFLEKESEIWHFASLLDSQGFPLKSAILLERALKAKKIKSNQKNHERLGDLWQRAQEGEKALKHYQKSAIFAKDGKIFAKMARLHRQFRDWKAMAKNIQKALEKGQVSRPENLYISLGTAYLQLKQNQKALKAFESVIERTKAKTSSIKRARQWIAYIQTIESFSKSSP